MVESSDNLKILYSDIKYTDSDIHFSDIIGGNKKSTTQNDKARGGFPPIYMMTKATPIKKPVTKERQFIKIDDGLSIRDILKNKK